MTDVNAIISVTAVLVGLYLILKIQSGTAFKDVFGALGGLYTQSVGALMGPGNITKGG